MFETVRSEGTRLFDSNPKSTTKKPSRQEGISERVRRAGQRFFNTVASAGLFSMSAISPMELPRNPGLDAQVPTTPVILHGRKEEALVRQNVLLLAEEGTSMDMLRRVATAYFALEPFNEQAGRTNIYGVKANEPLNCTQKGICNPDAVIRAIDHNMAVARTIFHETVVVVRRADMFSADGWTPVLEPRPDSPSVYTYAAVVIPEITDVNKDFKGLIDQAVEDITAHETAHSTYGIGHEGGDRMEGQEKCNPPVGNPPRSPGDGGMCHKFNEDHKARIRKGFSILPKAYSRPSINFTSHQPQADTVSSLAVNQDEKIHQLPTMALGYPPLYIPGECNWLKWEAVQVGGGPAITLIIGDPDVLSQFGRGYTIPAPDVANNKSTIFMHSEIITTRMWCSDEKQQPAWDSEAWLFHTDDGKRVPSGVAKIIHRTPDSTVVFGNATESKIPDTTPTLRFSSSDNSAWYVEVQASGDDRFDSNPATATSYVYGNYIHAGESNPKNSWTVPDNAAMPVGSRGYWRVRQRVQNPTGTPAKWSASFPFEIVSPAQRSLRDNAIDAHVIEQSKVTIKEGDVKIAGVVNRVAVLPTNRAERRKQDRLARSAV